MESFFLLVLASAPLVPLGDLADCDLGDLDATTSLSALEDSRGAALVAAV